MSSPLTTYLPHNLLNLLKQGFPALLLTVGIDNFPNTAYTWAVAPEATTIRFGADYDSSTLANLEREQQASLQIIGTGNLVFLVKGSITKIKAQIEAAPFKIALMALQVAEVKDQSWPGVSVQPLAYNWAPEQQEEMLAMEQAVYTEMRAWSE